MTTKYVTYCRVSTDQQGKSGLGLEAQERDIKVFLESYTTNAEVIGTFIDVKSGKGSIEDRQLFKQAVDLAKSSGATLLVAKLDRLSRDVETVARLIKMVDIKVACMPFADKFQLHLYAALAEQERDFISARTKAALAVAKSKGKLIGGAAVKKQCSNRKVYETQTQTKYEHLRQPLEALRSAGKTLQQVADQFNQFGYRTSNNAEFKAATVQRVCNYLGVI